MSSASAGAAGGDPVQPQPSILSTINSPSTSARPPLSSGHIQSPPSLLISVDENDASPISDPQELPPPSMSRENSGLVQLPPRHPSVAVTTPISGDDMSWTPVTPLSPANAGSPRLRPAPMETSPSNARARRLSDAPLPPGPLSPRPSPGRRALGKVGAPVPSPSPHYRSLMAGSASPGGTAPGWSADSGFLPPRTPRTPGPNRGGVRAVVPLAQTVQRPPLRTQMSPSLNAYPDLPSPITPGLGARKLSGVGLPTPSPTARTPHTPRLDISPNHANRLANSSPVPRDHRFVELQLPKRKPRGKSFGSAESLLGDSLVRHSPGGSGSHSPSGATTRDVPAYDWRTPPSGSPMLAATSGPTPSASPMPASSLSITNHLLRPATTAQQQSAGTQQPLPQQAVAISPLLSPSTRQLSMVAQASGSPRVVVSGGPGLTDLQLGATSDSIATTPTSASTPTTTAALVKSRSLSNPPAPISTSNSHSPSRRIIGGSTTRGSRHTANQHLLNNSSPADYLQAPQYSVIAEERESYLNSSTGSRSHDQPPSAGPSARSLPGAAHSHNTRADSTPRKGGGVENSTSAQSPRTGKHRSTGDGDTRAGSIISEYASGTDDRHREESHFFDELPVDFKAPTSHSRTGGKNGSGPSKTGGGGGGGRRFSDDYSTYKQKKIAARQDEKFQEKMRLQRSMNAGVHSRFAGGGSTLVEPDDLPFGFIHPSSPFFRFWKIFLLVSVWYSCFETSFVVSFDILCAFPKTYPVLVVLNCFVDLAMIGDVWVYSRKGYYDETLELHSSAIAIRRKYARSWLLLDLVAALPLEFVQMIVMNSTSDGASDPVVSSLAFQLLKLGRIFKMLKVINFSQTRKSLEINETVRTFFAFVYLVLIGHLVACGFHLLARLEEHFSPGTYTWISAAHIEGASRTDKYVYALYWSLATLISIGFGGHIAPVNVGERVYTVIVVVFAALAYAQVIGNFMLVIENINRSQSHHEQSLSFLQGYMTRHRFPPALVKKVLDFQSTNYTYLNANIGKHVYLRPEEEETYLRKEEEERKRTLMRHQTLREAKRQRAVDAAQAAAEGGTYVIDENGQESFLPTRARTPAHPTPDPSLPALPGSSSWLEEAIEEFDCEMDFHPGGAHAIGNSGRDAGEQHKQTNAAGDGRLHERSEDRILSTLPSCYSLEIMLHLHGRLIYNVFMFRDLNSSILSALTKELRTRLYVRDDFVTKRKLMGRRMYLVKRGVIERIEFSDLGKKIALAARRSHEEMEAREKKEEEKEREKSSSTQPSSFAARLLKRTRSTSSMHQRARSTSSGGKDYAALAANLLTAKPTIRRHNEGYVFGESSFLDGYFDETVRVASAVAEICVLEYSSFLRISEAYPDFAKCVLGHVQKKQDMERAKSAAEQNMEKEREARAMRKIERQQTVTLGRKASISNAGKRTSLEQVLHGENTKHPPTSATVADSPTAADVPVALSPTLIGFSATVGSPSHTSFAGTGTSGVSSQGSMGPSSRGADDVPRGSFATSITQLPPPAISGDGSAQSTTGDAHQRPHLAVSSRLHKASSSDLPTSHPRPSIPLIPESSNFDTTSRRASRTPDQRDSTQSSRDDQNHSEDSGNTDQPRRKYSTRHVSLLSQPASASISTDQQNLLHRRSLPAMHLSTRPTSVNSYEERKESSFEHESQ